MHLVNSFLRARSMHKFKTSIRYFNYFFCPCRITFLETKIKPFHLVFSENLLHIECANLKRENFIRPPDAKNGILFYCDPLL